MRPALAHMESLKQPGLSRPPEWPSLMHMEATAMAASISACDDNFGGGDCDNHSPSTGSGSTVQTSADAVLSPLYIPTSEGTSSDKHGTGTN